MEATKTESKTHMKTWFNGKLTEMYVGQVVTVYRCGEDHKEYVKTRRECLHATVGDAKEKGYCVSPKPVDAFSHMIHEEVRCCVGGRCAPVKQ